MVKLNTDVVVNRKNYEPLGLITNEYLKQAMLMSLLRGIKIVDTKSDLRKGLLNQIY